MVGDRAPRQSDDVRLDRARDSEPGRGVGLPRPAEACRSRGVPGPRRPPDLRGYIDLALRGGFPEPVLRLGDAARQAWLAAYIERLVSRDAEYIDGARDRVLLRRYFEALCVNAAGIERQPTLSPSSAEVTSSPSRSRPPLCPMPVMLATWSGSETGSGAASSLVLFSTRALGRSHWTKGSLRCLSAPSGIDER